MPHAFLNDFDTCKIESNRLFLICFSLFLIAIVSNMNDDVLPKKLGLLPALVVVVPTKHSYFVYVL